MEQETRCGGWSEFTSEIDSQAKEVFDVAMTGLTGVGYSPVAVAHQVVSGMNYKFFCNAIGIYPNAQTYPAMVSIYLPLNDKPHITEITTL